MKASGGKGGCASCHQYEQGGGRMMFGERTAVKPQYLLLEVFVSSAIASAVFVAVLPSVSARAAFRISMEGARTVCNRPTQSTLSSLAFQHRGSGLLRRPCLLERPSQGVSRSSEPRATACETVPRREAVAPSSQEIDNPNQPPSS